MAAAGLLMAGRSQLHPVAGTLGPGGGRESLRGEGVNRGPSPALGRAEASAVPEEKHRHPSPLPGSVDPSREADPEVLDLSRELEVILASTGILAARWAVLAVSLDRGDTLVSLNSGELMIPASNMKLLTTAAALSLLGADFRLGTYLLGDGPVAGGVLDGDLILFGTGDPTLSDRFFPSTSAPLDSLAHRLRRAGIEEVRGDLVVDGSFFRGPELHPEWDPGDLNETFAAPVSALAFNESVFTIRVRPGEWPGARPRVLTLPEETGIPVENTARTVAARSPARILVLRETPLDPVLIQGEIALGGREVWRRLPVPDPLLFAGHGFRHSMEAAGIHLEGRVRTVRDPGSSRLGLGGPTSPLRGPAPPRILVSHTSPPLLDILRVVNKESHNLFAEAVLRTLGQVVLGEGSAEGGSRVVERFLVEEVGVPPGHVRVRDGSGLSPGNRVSAAALVQLLGHMSTSPLWEDFWGTLPQAGLRRELPRMMGTPAAGNLRAKTGTLEGVSALSGMVRTRSGERILFAILSNDVHSAYRAKRAEDRIGVRLASLTRAP